MPSERQSEEIDIFNTALETAPGDRASYLDAVTASDTNLRRKIEALLAAHDRDRDSFGGLAVPASRRPGMTSDLNIGTVIDHFTLLKELGEGGCGVVYLAEQEQPIRRNVALKIIKAGMDTASVIARFEAERQTLAMMDHPNIAKVLDAGSTRTGRPYFVMELVKGQKVTDYCSEHKLSVNDGLHLFLQICDAVQHAHQKGHHPSRPQTVKYPYPNFVECFFVSFCSKFCTSQNHRFRNCKGDPG